MNPHMIPGTLHERIPEIQRGEVKIVHDTPDMLTLTWLRGKLNGQPLRAEKYTRLLIGGSLWMTDAEFECFTSAPIVSRMEGDVLIGGLGLGLILPAVLQRKSVKSVLVVERSADVISAVAPFYKSKKLRIVMGDVFTFEPDGKYDCIYLDVWQNVPNEDDAKDIARLKKRYAKYLRAGGWIKAWCEDYARRRWRA